MQNVLTAEYLGENCRELCSRCYENAETVFISDSGKTKLAIMGIDEYEKFKELKARFELYSLLEEGLEDVRQGRTRPAEEVFAELEKVYSLNDV